MCLWGAAFILFVLMKDQFALLASPSGKMILFTKKKMTMEMPPLSPVVPMLYMNSGTSRPATATQMQLMELTMQVITQNANRYQPIFNDSSIKSLSNHSPSEWF